MRSVSLRDLREPKLFGAVLIVVCGIPAAIAIGEMGWNMLHRLIYIIAVLGVIHFWMAVKKDITEPLIYAGIVAALLAWRAARWWTRRAGPHQATLAGAP